MADGADQLVTDVAAEVGCDLHVVVPKPLDVYREELSDATARRLDELRGRDDVALTTVEHGGADTLDDLDTAMPYQRLGIHLARSSHIVIALWDGEHERKPGGTLDVMARFLDRDYAPEVRDQVPHSIAPGTDVDDLRQPTAIWLRAARTGGAAAASVTTQYVVATGQPGVWRLSEHMPTGLARMLDDLARVARVSATVPRSEAGYPLLERLPDGLDPRRRRALQEIHDAYLTADHLALRFQSRSDKSFIGASLIAAVMGFAFLWFAKIDDHLGWLYGYMVMFLAGYLLFRTARARHWLGLHLSLRVAAETLRVRFFTSLVGVAESVDVRRILALTGVSGFPGFGWAAEVDRIGVPPARQLPVEVGTTSDLVRTEWVDGQAAYFKRKITQLHTRHERLELIQRVLYVLSFVTVVVIVVYGSELKKVHGPGDVSLKTILIFLMGLLPLWLTLWELHQGRMATRELLWQFRNQAAGFGRASVQLGDLDTDETRERIYVSLAESSLFETYLWTIHRFHREFTPPSGG